MSDINTGKEKRDKRAKRVKGEKGDRKNRKECSFFPSPSAPFAHSVPFHLLFMKFQRRKRPDGYSDLLVYKRTVELQDFIYRITNNFPYKESRRRIHMRDSARSVKQNIVEGWKRETTQQYIDFLSFSFGSLGELKEDGKDCIKLGILDQQNFQELMRRCGEIDYLMGRLKNSLENKIVKMETLSPYQRWVGNEIEKKREEDKKTDEELKKIIDEERKKRDEL